MRGIMALLLVFAAFSIAQAQEIRVGSEIGLTSRQKLVVAKETKNLDRVFAEGDECTPGPGSFMSVHEVRSHTVIGIYRGPLSAYGLVCPNTATVTVIRGTFKKWWLEYARSSNKDFEQQQQLDFTRKK